MKTAEDPAAHELDPDDDGLEDTLAYVTGEGTARVLLGDGFTPSALLANLFARVPIGMETGSMERRAWLRGFTNHVNQAAQGYLF